MPSHSASAEVGDANDEARCSCDIGALPHFPALLDETTFSYVSRAHRLASCATRNSVISALFGGQKIAVHRPLHSGFGAFSLHLYGQISNIALAKHGLMALFQTFSHPDRYAKALEQAMSGKPRAYLYLYSAQSEAAQKDAYFRASPALCTACVEQDLRDFHFAYYRRQHQVLACEYCAKHEKRLITSCGRCSSTLSFAGLPTLHCPDCGASYASDEIAERGSCRPFKVRLSQFINSMLLGELPSIPQTRRLEILAERSKKIVGSSSLAPGNALVGYIQSAYGNELLSQLRLSLAYQGSVEWPTKILSGTAMLESPTTNALLTSALWDSANEYFAEM